MKLTDLQHAAAAAKYVAGLDLGGDREEVRQHVGGCDPTMQSFSLTYSTLHAVSVSILESTVRNNNPLKNILPHSSLL